MTKTDRQTDRQTDKERERQERHVSLNENERFKILPKKKKKKKKIFSTLCVILHSTPFLKRIGTSHVYIYTIHNKKRIGCCRRPKKKETLDIVTKNNNIKKHRTV